MQIVRNQTDYQTTDYYDGTQVVATCISIWKTDDKINQTRSIKHSGINRHTGKRWYRWKFDGSAGFRRTSTGKIMPYALNAKKKAVSTLPLLRQFHDYQNGGQVPDDVAKFFDTVVEHFGIQAVSDLYPVMKFYKIERRDAFAQELLPMMRHTEYRDFIMQAYGKKNFRKDLVKACADADLYNITYTRPFRGNVPTDWIINFLRNNGAGLQFDQYSQTQTWDTWKTLVPRLSTNTKRAMLNEIWDADTPREFEDTMRMVRMLPEGDRMNAFLAARHRTVHEMHEALTPYRRNAYQAAAIENQPIEYKWDTSDWHEAEVGDMVVTLAQETDDMSKWGQEMRNCIASYRRQAVAGTAIYGAVHRNGKLIGNYEIKGARLTQLLGKANSKMADKDIAILEPWIAGHGAGINVDNYWGKPNKILPNEGLQW